MSVFSIFIVTDLWAKYFSMVMGMQVWFDVFGVIVVWTGITLVASMSVAVWLAWQGIVLKYFLGKQDWLGSEHDNNLN